MMANGNGSSKDYSIDMSGALRNKLKALVVLAKSKGALEAFQNAMVYIQKRLSKNPLEFGELYKSYPEIRMIAHRRLVYPILVDFGIHLDKHFVIIRDIRYMEDED